MVRCKRPPCCAGARRRHGGCPTTALGQPRGVGETFFISYRRVGRPQCISPLRETLAGFPVELQVQSVTLGRFLMANLSRTEEVISIY